MTLKVAEKSSLSRGEMVSAEAIREILAGDGFPPLSKETLSTFVSDGMPKVGHGKYDRDVCVGWYLARLRANVKRKATESKDGSVLSLDEAQRRLTTVKAESEEMSLAERRGELVPLTLYVSEMSHVAVSIRQSILAIPNQIASDLADRPKGEIKAILTKELKSALSQLAQKGGDRGETKKPESAGKKASTRGRSKPR